MKIKRFAQSVIEYAILIAVVAGAFMAMNMYFQRATQARLRQVQKELSDDIEVINVGSVN